LPFQVYDPRFELFDLGGLFFDLQNQSAEIEGDPIA